MIYLMHCSCILISSYSQGCIESIDIFNTQNELDNNTKSSLQKLALSLHFYNFINFNYLLKRDNESFRNDENLMYLHSVI